jgi:hypothetical protein
VALSLTDKIVRLHEALTASSLPHGFGGALALAYCTEDPRATHDIDVNIFVGTDQVGVVLDALPRGIVAREAERRLLERDAQARLWWDGTPVDVFLSNHPFHQQTHNRCRQVPFSTVADLPVLSCGDLAVFKAFFARPKDAVDIATMVQDGQLDGDQVLDEVIDLLGPDHPNIVFMRNAIALGGKPS